MNPILQQLKDPHIRRLAWCLFADPMAHISSAAHLDLGEWHDITALEDWLKKLDQQPKPLHDYILAGNHRLLGSYFERLWQFFFSYHPQWNLLADHVQIIHEKQTLGELDLIVRNPEHDIVHIELATKWYLQAPGHTGANTHDWLGPQTKDRLDLKIKKLKDKQFPFAQHPQVIDHLKTNNLPLPQAQRLVMKGGLFTQLGEDFTLPSCTPPTIEVFPWCHHQTLGSWTRDSHLYCLLEKHEWLGPAQITEHSRILTRAQLLEVTYDHFVKGRHPYALMICDLGSMDLYSHETQQMEVARIMVVKDDWPR
ncbi:DUF1853 family protein [Bermanella marisrubri]|uniref:DUF1853 family protein n=1 Tax=Bermanella marisrubri TaxID=207949 RepID=Q1N0L9_9GAMM|nr:DUF1853 family protein [Bermanella marisrubri]EAT11814.1 hypothetical protein RED65_05489 [Oceanobacter sp. RED65] [Bermanella marisrubri]QIZ83848.1 DUF1853 family protein [Bermanella marisrubri]